MTKSQQLKRVGISWLLASLRYLTPAPTAPGRNPAQLPWPGQHPAQCPTGISTSYATTEGEREAGSETRPRSAALESVWSRTLDLGRPFGSEGKSFYRPFPPFEWQVWLLSLGISITGIYGVAPAPRLSKQDIGESAASAGSRDAVAIRGAPAWAPVGARGQLLIQPPGPEFRGASVQGLSHLQGEAPPACAQTSGVPGQCLPPPAVRFPFAAGDSSHGVDVASRSWGAPAMAGAASLLPVHPPAPAHLGPGLLGGQGNLLTWGGRGQTPCLSART